MQNAEREAGFQYAAKNEPVLEYLPNSPERSRLMEALQAGKGTCVEIPLVIGGRHVTTAQQADVVAPHEHARVLAKVSQADTAQAQEAVAAAAKAHNEWANWSLEDRSAVFLKAADLLAGSWRDRMNAATMLGQSKSVHQSEIDAACELIDFLRFNVQFASEIHRQQPLSPPGVSNALDYRPLEGFVYAITPFNFTAIGGNLATAPAIMGNVVIWKPAATATLSNYLFMQVLEEAGLPPGVINFLPGDPQKISNVLLSDTNLAGVHFTGSTTVFDKIWQEMSGRLAHYRNYPRTVGETGGKDFVLAHPSADIGALVVALLRGAFEFQGQKCSAASRAYIPRSIWPRVRDELAAMVATIKIGDVAEFDTFMGAVIDQAAFGRIAKYLSFAREDSGTTVIAGGNARDEVGYFVEPTVLEVKDPKSRLMSEEIFGPLLSVYVYNDAEWPAVLDLVESTSPYALTGAVFAEDPSAIEAAGRRLRFAAGNFYINDKPTGAVVGQQPFGGGRRSGTNDKAGAPLNLMRWTSPRTIKRTHEPARDYRYPHMQE